MDFWTLRRTHIYQDIVALAPYAPDGTQAVEVIFLETDQLREDISVRIVREGADLFRLIDWDGDQSEPSSGADIVVRLGQLETEAITIFDEEEGAYYYSLYSYFLDRGDREVDYDAITRTYRPLALANLVVKTHTEIVTVVNNTAVYKLV